MSVNNGGAGREDPDAVLLKATKVYSNSEKAKTENAAEPDIKKIRRVNKPRQWLINSQTMENNKQD